MNVYIYDLIGIKSGCMYYNDSMIKSFIEHGYNVELISNYSIDNRPARIKNIYSGILLFKLLKLFHAILCFVFILLFKKYSKFIYLSYGNRIDYLFLYLGSWFKNFMVDIHEYIALDGDYSEKSISKADTIVKKIPACIYHSERTKEFLLKAGVSNKLYVPHFNYIFDKSYDEKFIDTDVKSLIDKKRNNILLFGHLRESKGVDFVINAIQSMDKDLVEKCNFIFFGADTKCKYGDALTNLKKEANISFLLRYVETKELNYIFDKSDLILLPYNEVSQSGIIETAVYFRKKMLLSNVLYFKQFIDKYNSFGYIYVKGDILDFISVLSNIIHDSTLSYDEDELDLFYKKEEFEIFFKEFKSLIRNKQN